MQKLLLTGAMCLVMNGLSAQPWMGRFEGESRVKLQDVVDAHRPSAPEEESGKVRPLHFVKEGKSYHFDRWRWYWERHLDAEGYIVPRMKTAQEWAAYKARTAGTNHKKTASDANWTFQGPTASPANGKGLGRIQKITFHPTDSNTYWVGTAGGGAWKTTDNGVSWACMTDMLPVLGVADVTYNPLNPSVIYLCTGDRDATDNSSIGLLKSVDGGLTWNTTGFQFVISAGEKTNALLVNPLDTAALTMTTSVGIYQSRDGGATWAQRTPGRYRELLYMPGDTTVMYATSGTYIGSAQIYRSGNGGASWTQVTNLLNGPSRVNIAVTASSPKIVKAIFANSTYGLEGIYHSSDTGKTFTKIFNPSSCAQNMLANDPAPTSNDCDGQGWFDLAIAVSPVDSNQVVIGGINTWYSSDGGLNWQLANQWWGYVPGVKTVHADKHYMAFQPLRPNVLFEGNDGGIYKTSNILSTAWQDITNGMGITQFYRLAVANHTPSVLGGAQDNGSKRINPGFATTELTGGDGMNCEFDPTSSSFFYTSSQNGTIYRNNSTVISNNIPGRPRGAWITPYAIHPLSGARIIAGYDKVYMSNNQGDSWTAISPTFSSQPISRIALGHTNMNVIYAIAGGLVRQTLDGGATWKNLTGAPNNGSLSDIAVDPKDNEHIWVTFSGYGSDKVAEWDPVNGWQERDTDLPNVPVNCVTIDTSNGSVYIGTDVAVFYRDKVMTTWALWNNNLPAAEVTDLGINYTTGELWAATYGRGMWKTPKADAPVIPTGISTIPFATNVITVSPNPANGPFDIQTSNESLIGQPATVTMLDISGRVVWSGQRSFSRDGMMHIEVANLPRATYIVDVTAQNGMKARTKLVMF